MNQITPEGVKPFLYFAKSDSTPLEGDRVCGYLVCHLQPYMQENLYRLPNVRLVLVPEVLAPGEAWAYYLFWEHGEGIEEIDERVRTATYTDQDFHTSVRTRHSVTRCFSCGRSWHTLILLPDELYLEVSGLSERKFSLYSGKWKRCPGCGASLRQLVVMVIEEA